MEPQAQNNPHFDAPNGPEGLFAELALLLGRLADEQLSSTDQQRLLQLLKENPAAREYYLDYMELHARLQWKQLAQTTAGQNTPLSEPSVPSQRKEPLAEPYWTTAAKPRPKVVIETSPPRPIPWYSVNSPIGLPLRAYTLGAIIMLIAIGIGAVVHITHSYEIAAREAAISEEESGSGGGLFGAPATAEKAKPKKEEAPVVGHISGMVGCRWADSSLKPLAPRIRQGTKFVLKSGLMEITYTTGAKVILQGPCTYEVESPVGGYLALGKLTAKVASGQRRVASEGPGAANHKSEISNHKSAITESPNLQISKFTVRTPTALITDLGTEFGVEVDEERNTLSHVFQGRIEVRLVGDFPENESRIVVLGANQSARVERGGEEGKPRAIRLDASEAAAYSAKFARRLREPPKFLDLLDIVAGGDGTGSRRERGIDPTTGAPDRQFVAYTRYGSGDYHTINWNDFIDGVFVPLGASGAVQIDSTGGKFEGFSKASGITFGSIWARSPDIARPDLSDHHPHWVYSMGRGEQFMPEGRGLLALHSNVGITFDLEAMRRIHRGTRPRQFSAVVGMVDLKRLLPNAAGVADVWVLIDGQVKFKRPQLLLGDGVIKCGVEIGPTDRFLTLAVTDPGAGHAYALVVFGDPLLELETVETEEGK